MSWTCEQLEARLSDYLDGHLSAEELQGFSGHVAACSRCAPLVAQVSSVLARVHVLEPAEPPQRLIHNILDATIGPQPAAAPVGWLGWMRLAMQPRFAMGLVTVVLALLFVSQALGIQWNRIEMADLKPVNLYRSANSRAHLLYARGVKFVNDLRVVYEIQTRLEPQPEAQPQPQRAPGATESQPDPRRERDLNRADDLKPVPVLLASALGGLPGRSIR
jgi:anti-sigma factor RsiW